MIGCGLGGNVDFENDFVSKYDCMCLAFDGDSDTYKRTLDQVKSEKITVIKQNIGVHNTPLETDLKSIIASHCDIFLKMDIEGYNFGMGEWPWLNSLTSEEIQTNCD